MVACQKRRKVCFNTAAALVQARIEAMDERRLQRLQTGFAANDLLITDEWASFPSARPAPMPDAEVQALARGRTAVIYHHDPRQKGGHDAEVDHWIEGIAGSTLASCAKA